MSKKRMVFRLFLVAVLLFSIVNFINSRRKTLEDIPGVTKSFHDNGHINTLILTVEDGSVRVLAVESKMKIDFRPEGKDLNRFHIGWIAPVTFKCSEGYNEKCNLSKPYKLYASNVLVKPIKIVGNNGL